eukprot:CAMPEP_0172724948 /NCGR_PEP_ID=MMETSP1074-20121228/87231_1 /TAXON_ID=2916 /ORGANISM="Ceratium fusus, Strain PA161109" /LENGTH=327 /DNA_ID=CAMNT_0013551591 /DNA_START=69 /DNA_END=1053 /DNA_ORIENTATION=+
MSFVAAQSPGYEAQYALQYAQQYGQQSQPQYAGYAQQPVMATVMPTTACGYPSTTTATTYGTSTYGAPSYGAQTYGTNVYASPTYDAAGSYGASASYAYASPAYDAAGACGGSASYALASPAYASPAYDTAATGGGSASYAIQQTSAAPPMSTLPTAQSMVAYPSMPSAMNGPFQFYPNDAPGGPGSSLSAGTGQASMNAMSNMGSSMMNTAGGTMQSSMDYAGNTASTAATSVSGKPGKVSANKNSSKKASGKKKKSGAAERLPKAKPLGHTQLQIGGASFGAVKGQFIKCATHRPKTDCSRVHAHLAACLKGGRAATLTATCASL